MDPATVYLWMLVFLRACGLLLLVPVFSGQTLPPQLRLAIAAILTLAVVGSIKGPVPSGDLWLLFVTAARELLIGLLMGGVARMVIYSLEFAGQVMSTDMGLMMGAQMDPISRANTSPLGLALTYFGALLFLISGSHHTVLAAFVRSFTTAPLGAWGFQEKAPELFVVSTGKIFLVAIQMCAPLMAINFIVSFTYAVLGKAAPSINILSESFSVRIVAGIAIFGVALGLTAQLVLSLYQQAPELMLQFAR